MDVANGVGRYGRGKGKPYIFINFGNWQNDCVKLTIWSEGLDNFSKQPGQELIGKWVSAVGLIEPPYHGNYKGKPYSNVGVTIERESQIEGISEKEAKYRLGGGKSRPQVSTATVSSNNEDILKGLLSSASINLANQLPMGSSQGTKKPSGVQTKNQAILDSLKPQKRNNAFNTVQQTRNKSSYQKPPKKRTPPSHQDSSSWIFWLIGFALIVYLIFG